MARKKMSDEERKRRVREYKRRWYKANTEKQLEWNRRWKKANPERDREHRRRCQYGLSDEQLSTVRESRACDLCRSGLIETGQAKLSKCVDHDHSDGYFRGVLCKQCNLGLGKLGDDVQGVVRAALYLIDARLRHLRSQLDDEQLDQPLSCFDLWDV